VKRAGHSLHKFSAQAPFIQRAKTVPALLQQVLIAPPRADYEILRMHIT